MGRRVAISGSSSGIGKAVKARLEARGDTIIGIDPHDADVIADLGSREGQDHLAAQVREISPSGLDVIVAVAGVSLPLPLTVKVNYFGALATLSGLRPLLASSAAPRAVAVSSFAVLFPVDGELLQALRANDQATAVARAAALAAELDPREAVPLIYGTSKRALSDWVRRTSITDEWAGAGIPLNAVAPGIVNTPMMAAALATPEGRAEVLRGVPMPLGGAAEPETIASLLDWLVSAENTHVTGQTIFIDGGGEATVHDRIRES